MPILDFPDSPTVGQIFTASLQSWMWDGISWNIIPTVSGGGEASIAVGPTAPLTPDDGDMWWDTDEPSLLNSIVDPVALVADATFQAELAASAVYNAVLNSRYNRRVGYAKVVTNMGGTFTTITDLTGMTIPFTAVAGRLYKIMAQGFFFSTVDNDVVRIEITDASNVEIGRGQGRCGTNSNSGGIIQAHTLATFPGGATTIKCRGQRTLGTGAIQFNASAVCPAIFIIEDIGPE